MGFWCAAALMAALVMYPLTFGPASWFACRSYCALETVESAYRPILWLGTHNRIVGKVATWYMALGVANDVHPKFNDHCISFARVRK